MTDNSARTRADALVQQAHDLIEQHQQLFAKHGLPTDATDRLLARDDLPQPVRDRIQQEMMAASEAARSQEFALAREAREGAAGRPPKMKPGMGRMV